MWTLLRKEFSYFFASASGWVVVGVFLLLTGLLLWVVPGEYNIPESGYAQMDGLFVWAPWLYLFLIPAVTMRSFADEKRQGTLELLVTRPLTSAELVGAKYGASLLLAIVALLPTVVYYISIYLLASPVGNVDSGGVWGSYVGLVMLAVGYCAVGVWASALTDNAIVSFLVAAAVCFVLYQGFGMAAEMVGGRVSYFIDAMGMASHYESMSRGVIDSRDVLYFVGVAGVFIGLTTWKIRR